LKPSKRNAIEITSTMFGSSSTTRIRTCSLSWVMGGLSRPPL
jgi:hypothetical protein